MRKHFGTFDVDLETGELRRNGLKLQLQEKPFQMLAMLLEHPGEVVTREALRERLWPAGTFVDFDHGLNTATKKLRHALDDSAENPRFIETLARRGYRFIAPVTPIEAAGTGSPVLRSARARTGDRRDVAHRSCAPVSLPCLALLPSLSSRSSSRSSCRAAQPARPPTSAVKRVAVLPFENLGPKEDDYFADGITDEVRGKLTNLPGLEVIARTSSNGYRNTEKTTQQIGKELDAEYLLTGAVRFAEESDGTRRVQVSPELSLASSGASRWAQPFDATLTDVFQVQGEIATRVAQALDVALSPVEKRRLEAKSTQSLPAYDAYLRGEEASQSMTAQDPPSLRVAIGHYEQAVALDPRFMEAWARLSQASSFLYTSATPTPAGAERALFAAEQALAIAPERPEGHQALGYYYTLIVKDSARALPEMERARRLSPGSADTPRRSRLPGSSLDNGKRRWAISKQALRIDPRSLNTLRRLGFANLRLRRHAESRMFYDRGLALAPANLVHREQKAMTYLAEGDLAGARAVLTAAPKEVDPTALVAFVANYADLAWLLDEAQRDLLLRLTPSAFDNRGIWAHCLAQASALKRDEANVRKYAGIARAEFEKLLEAVPKDAQIRVLLGLSLAYLGRKAEAIREAERAVELLPISRDAHFGPYIQHQLVRVYILTGEYEKALDRLEPLLKIPYHLTPAWLEIDPNFDPLRQTPRFQMLIGKGRPRAAS